MKCISKMYVKEDGSPAQEVVRTSDGKARELVDTGEWSFVPKRVWRNVGRKYLNSREAFEMNTYEFHKGMREHFGIANDAGKLLCDTMLKLKHISLDIVKFDGWLIEKLGYDYNVTEGLSMKDAIIKYYTPEAAEFVKKAL